MTLQLADGLEDGVVAQEFELLIDVNRINAGPTSIDDDLGVFPADTPTTIALSDLLINDSDPDGDALALVSFSQPANGTLVQELDGNLTYTPNPGFRVLNHSPTRLPTVLRNRIRQPLTGS